MSLLVKLTGRNFNIGGAVTPPPGTTGGFSSSTMLFAVQNTGATVDNTAFTDTLDALPTYIRQNASMISLLPSAYKAGSYYSFDNRPGIGALITHSFVRNTQATTMYKDDAIWLHQINEPVFEYASGYQAEKQALINSINANPAKKLVTSFLPTGYVTDGSVNYTTQLNTALSAGGDIIMPNFPIMIDGANNATVRNNTRLLFQANSELWVKPGYNGYNYDILMLRGRNNVVVIDANIRGDKGYGGLSPLSYERGQGINLGGCQNITLYDPIVHDCWGDGIYTNFYLLDVQNITIHNAVCHNNGRNNISLTNGINIRLQEPILVAADKSNPVAGLDVEPNDSTINGTKKLTDLFIINPITYDNLWSGIQLAMGLRYRDPSDPTHLPNPGYDILADFDITIQNHFSNNEAFGQRITIDKNSGDVTGLQGTISFLNPELNNAAVYAAPPGGGPATTNPPFQDGDKIMIKQFIDDPGMTLEFLHPKINVNGVQYSDAQLLDFYTNEVINQRTTKVIAIP